MHRCEIVNEKALLPFELKTKRLIANDDVNFCFEVYLDVFLKIEFNKI